MALIASMMVSLMRLAALLISVTVSMTASMTVSMTMCDGNYNKKRKIDDKYNKTKMSCSSTFHILI